MKNRQVLLASHPQGAVVPGNFGWSDIGSWNAVSELVEPDEHNNRTVGEAILIDSSNEANVENNEGSINSNVNVNIINESNKRC